MKTLYGPTQEEAGNVLQRVWGKVSKRRFKEMCVAANNRRELIAHGLTSRRALFKLRLLTAGGVLVAKSGLNARAQSSGGSNISPGSQQLCIPGDQAQSPQAKPFIDPLPIMPVTVRVQSLTPTPTLNPNVGAGEVRASAFQAPQIDTSRFPIVPAVLNNVFQRQFTTR